MKKSTKVVLLYGREVYGIFDNVGDLLSVLRENYGDPNLSLDTLENYDHYIEYSVPYFKSKVTIRDEKINDILDNGL